MDIVFYTCFFGNDSNWANLIPSCPTTKYPCYYFTNNPNTFAKLSGTNWIPIFLNDFEIKHDMVESAFQAKLLKSCPHKFDIINKHKYNCYFDSKHNVDADKIEKWVEFLENNKYEIILPKHPLNFTCVWEEYNLAMQYEKYAKEGGKSKQYIESQLNTLSDKVDYHLATQFIIRKNTSKISELNEVWYTHIIECGIMCQLSFFFIQQLYKEYVYPIAYQDCYSYCF
jgi:hypothetical protein